MSANSSIEWTDRTWNPVTGCTKVSAGCKNCYAEGVAERFWATQYPKVPDEGHGIPGAVNQLRTREFTDVQAHEDRLLEPLSWRKPARVFVNSMSDLFHEDIPSEFIARVFAVMAFARQHTFQILTKRAERMRAVVSDPLFRDEVDVWITMMLDDEDRPPALRWDPLDRRKDDANALAPDVQDVDGWPLPNVWLGVSVENQKYADERIPLLLQTPAAVRFISAEPLLGPVDLRGRGLPGEQELMAGPLRNGGPMYLGGPFLDWVIVGGESGPGARPCHVEWLADIAKVCRAAHVPAFVKQVGSVPYVRAARLRHWEWRGIKRPEDKRFTEAPDDALGWRVHLSDRKGGDMAEWPVDLRVREFPEATV